MSGIWTNLMCLKSELVSNFVLCTMLLGCLRCRGLGEQRVLIRSLKSLIYINLVVARFSEHGYEYTKFVNLQTDEHLDYGEPEWTIEIESVSQHPYTKNTTFRPINLEKVNLSLLP